MIVAFLFYFVLFLAVARYAVYKGRRRRLEELMEKLPGPKCLPLLGNIHMCFGSSRAVLLRAYNMLYRMEGPIRLWIGPIPFVIIRDPKNFQIVCNGTQSKSYEYKFMKDFLGEGLITASGEKWRQKRRSLNPAFNVNLMNIYFLGIFNEFNAKLIKSLDGVANLGREIDLWHYVFKCTRDTICVTAMGYRDAENEENSPMLKYGAILETASTLVTERMMKPWLHPYPLFQLYNYITGNDKIFERAFELPLQIIRKKKEEIILDSNNNDNNDSESELGKSDKEDKRNRNFIDILLKSEVFRDLPENELAEEVVTFILTGSETSAITISFTLLMLACKPECQELVYDELMTVFEGDCDRPVELEDLNHLPYMERCIKETLRRFPPAPMTLRQVEKDLVLADGEILPAGARALMGIIGIHLSEKTYENPFEWNPDRFTPEEIRKRHPCSFVPFSVGSRSCIGAKYAMFTIKTHLATILRKFKFSTDLKIQDIRLGFDIVLRNKTGYKVYITRRN